MGGEPNRRNLTFIFLPDYGTSLTRTGATRKEEGLRNTFELVCLEAIVEKVQVHVAQQLHLPPPPSIPTPHP